MKRTPSREHMKPLDKTKTKKKIIVYIPEFYK